MEVLPTLKTWKVATPPAKADFNGEPTPLVTFVFEAEMTEELVVMLAEIQASHYPARLDLRALQPSLQSYASV